MKKDISHRPSTEQVTAISLPSDDVAIETRSSLVRRASGGKASMRRVPFLYGGKESGAFVCSVINQRYVNFFYPESDQLVPLLPTGLFDQGVKL